MAGQRLAQILHNLSQALSTQLTCISGTGLGVGRWRKPDSGAAILKHDNGIFGLIVGGFVALMAVIFIFSGGELGGKKTVAGDEDLPPIASADQ
jgi:hypothetical protein